MYRLLSGIFMGWSLGSNDSANIFGTAVFSKKIRYRTAVILCAVFVIAGALLIIAPGPTCAMRASGSTRTSFIGDRSIIIPPSQAR